MLWLGVGKGGKYLHPEEKSPEVYRTHTPEPRRQRQGLPAVWPLTAAPVAATIAIRTLLLRPGLIHDQGPPRELRTMQSFDSLLRLSWRTHIDKTKSPRLPGIFIGNDTGGFDRTMR